MGTLRISNDNTFFTEVIVKESDKYSGLAYLKLERHYIPEEIRACNEMFLTPNQLELLGKFLITQAEELKLEQKFRNEYKV